MLVITSFNSFLSLITLVLFVSNTIDLPNLHENKQTISNSRKKGNSCTTSEKTFDRVCGVRLRHDFPFVACCPSHLLEERGIQTNFLQLLFIDTTPDVQMFARPWSNADAAPVYFNNVFFCCVLIFCVFRVISTFTFFPSTCKITWTLKLAIWTQLQIFLSNTLEYFADQEEKGGTREC